MRILVLNADYPRFLDWFYRRQPELEERRLCRADGGAKRQPVRRRRFLFAEFRCTRPQRGRDPRQQSLAAIGLGARARTWRRSLPSPRASGGSDAPRLAAARRDAVQADAAAVGAQGRPQPEARRARPRRSCWRRSRHFKPDLILNQDTFHVDTALMRRIKGIGNPILIGQVGIAPSRGEDWTVYDLMMSQLSATVEFFRRLGVRAEVNHLAFEPAILDALPAAACAGYRRLLRRHGVAGSPAAHRAAGGRRRALRSQTVRQPAAGAAGLLAAAPLLSGRGLGRRHVSGACGARGSRSIRISTWPAAKPATCGCSRRPASARSC